jgi:hypothetical protein
MIGGVVEAVLSTTGKKKKFKIIIIIIIKECFSFLLLSQVGMWMFLDSTNGIMDDGIDVDLWIASSI